MGTPHQNVRVGCRKLSPELHRRLTVFLAQYGSSSVKRLRVNGATLDKLISGASAREEVVQRIEDLLAHWSADGREPLLTSEMIKPDP